MENIREKILKEIDEMSTNELLLLYNQIKLMKDIRTKGKRSMKSWSLEEIHRLTSTSKTCWADTIISERKERL